MWGRVPEEAALPAVDLVCGDAVEHQALGLPRIVARSAGSGIAKLLKRPTPTPDMNVTVIDPRS